MDRGFYKFKIVVRNFINRFLKFNKPLVGAVHAIFVSMLGRLNQKETSLNFRRIFGMVDNVTKLLVGSELIEIRLSDEFRNDFECQFIFEIFISNVNLEIRNESRIVVFRVDHGFINSAVTSWGNHSAFNDVVNVKWLNWVLELDETFGLFLANVSSY
jgi:hypothetical protein